jgi:transcriptional regulator with XRE-family HTH domain
MPVEFGKWVREQRLSRRMTVTECAERAGMTHSQLSRLELCMVRQKDGSPSQPTRKTVEKLAVALNIPLSEALLAARYSSEEMEPSNARFTKRLEFILSDLPPGKRKQVEQLLEADAAKYKSLVDVI